MPKKKQTEHEALDWLLGAAEGMDEVRLGVIATAGDPSEAAQDKARRMIPRREPRDLRTLATLLEELHALDVAQGEEAATGPASSAG